MSSEKTKNGKLVLKVVGIVAAIVVILCTAETTVIERGSMSRIKNVNTDTYQQIGRIYSNVITKTLDEYIGYLDFYVKADVVKTESTPQIVSWLREHENKRSEAFDYVAWVDADANFYSDVGSKTSIPDRDYFQAIMLKGKDTFIDNPVTSKTTGKTIVHICKAAKVNGRTVGFFCAVVNINRLVVLLDDIKLDEKAASLLFSGDGQLIALAGDKNAMGDQNNPKVLEINAELKAVCERSSANGTGELVWKKIPVAGNELFVIEPVKLTPWTLAIIVPANTVYGVAYSIVKLLTIFSVILALAIIIGLSVTIYSSLTPLKIVEKSILDIATGNADLTKRIDIDTNDEIGRVVDGFNKFSEKLQAIISAMKDSKQELVTSGETLQASTEDTSAAIHQIITNIESFSNNINTQNDSVNQTAGAVNEIASNIESLNKMIESQASAVTQASAAVEEMIGNINSVNNSVQKMAEEFEELEKRAVVGVQRQDEVNDKINTIEIESQALKEANAVISNIAEQTNLLAMNAAIEAAHAGEAGKGFSVVADEIRKLSETSGTQSKTIGDQLNRITDSIEDIVSTSVEAKEAFAIVSNGIQQTNGLVQEIKNSMQEQGEGSKQISIALNNMNDTTQEVRTSSYEMAEGNKAILEEIKKLQDASFSMKTGMEEMNSGALKINETGTALSTLAKEMEESIENIGEQVDQFKV